jgi:betaine-aldehyde dehydrogenase
MKPAEITPLTTMRLGELALEAGIPEGVLNVIVGTGAEVGWRFVRASRCAQGGLHRLDRCRQTDHGGLRRSGESASLWSSAARAPTSCSLMPTSRRQPRRRPAQCSTTRAQDCCARSRVLVERSVFDRFLELFVAAAGQWKVGDPMDAATAMGPLVTAAHLGKVRSFTDGLDTVFTGEAPSGPGFWHPS